MKRSEITHITDIRPVAARRLFPQNVRSLQLGRDSLRLDTREQGVVEVALDTARIEAVSAWLVLKSLTLVTPAGAFRLDGITREAVRAVEGAIREAQRRQGVLASLRSQASGVTEAHRTWEALAARDAYLTATNVEGWLRGLAPFDAPTGGDTDLIDRLPEDTAVALRRLAAVRADPRGAADERNAAYAREQLRLFQAFFDTVEAQPLTEEQRLAVVHDEDNALVIAGAGTGKTSTIVAKVGFLLQKGWAKPDEILLLAFTKKAAEEMQERLRRRLGTDLHVRTFHALGLEIVGAARGKKPSLCPEAEDDVVRDKTLAALIATRLSEDGFRRDYLAFRASLRQPYKPAWEFGSQAEYTQYLLDAEPRALTGRLLKSYEECEIANWLFTHGIRFEYERPYEVDTATETRRQYKPDFYLPDHGIYIEHWGVDKGGYTAPFINSAEYRAGMEWKRELHRTHGTKLVETFSWERQEGDLLQNLQRQLAAHGVPIRPLSPEEAERILSGGEDAAQRADPFVGLVASFLPHFKSAGLRLADLQAKAGRVGNSSDGQRNALFLRLFGPLYEDYEKTIHANGEVDFDDMIAMARAHVADGTYRSPFRYILVDEFQDIALGRAALIHALKKQVAGAKLFCVGDDWQSIYRFSGSNITLTTEFDRFFGFTRKTTLGLTFRFHDKIAAFSSRFVQQNPHQLRKELSTRTASAEPGVVVLLHGGTDSLRTALEEISKSVREDGTAATGQRSATSVLLLGRYRRTLPRREALASLRSFFPDLQIEAMTAHASKGLEADFVIVLDVNQGKYGFPSEIADDPALALVLPESERFPYAEERRLFYVAVTRAKRRVYLIGDPAAPSAFLREVLRDAAYEKTVVGAGSSASNVCPSCQRGAIVQKTGENGAFYGCANFPLCAYKPPSCPRCKRGWMRDAEEERTTAGEMVARCGSCGFLARRCPECATGVVVERRSQWGPFWGCSNYGRKVDPCRFKVRI